MSSSIRGTPYCASRSSTARFFASGIRSRRDRGKLAISLGEPRGFPPVGFVWEIILGVDAPIARVPRPAKGLIEALPLGVHRSRGQDKRRLEGGELGDHRVMDGDSCLPHARI